jgi:hypothetical protein
MIFGRYPVDILNLVKGLLGLLTLYGVSISGDQQTSLLETLGYVLVLIVGGYTQRQLVTPLADPVLPVGAPVTTPKGNPAQVVAGAPA